MKLNFWKQFRKFSSNTEYIAVRGNLKISKIDVWGNRIICYDDSNLVMTNMHYILAHLLAQGTSTYKIDKIDLGTDDGSILPLAVTNTALGATSLGQTAVDSYSYLGAGLTSVKFSLLLGYATGNGVTYAEAGIFASGDTKMVARRTFTGIAKTASYKLLVDWTFAFTS